MAAHRIYYLNPDLAPLLSKKAVFLPYLYSPSSAQPIKFNKVFVIAHAPTNRSVKGTSAIISAIDKLSLKGFSVNLRLVEGCSQSEALSIYSKCNLAIDQIYYGWYGIFAVECLSLGIPVACYIRDSDLLHIPSTMANDLPFIRITPSRIFEPLANFLSADQSVQEDTSQRSKSFAKKWHLEYPRQLIRESTLF